VHGEKIVILTSGIAHTYVKEAVKLLKPSESVAVLKLGIVNPLPADKIRKALESADLVLIVEEGDPFLEMQIKAIVVEGQPKEKGKFWGVNLTWDAAAGKPKRILVFVEEPEQNAKLLGPACGNEVFVHQGNILGIPDNEKWAQIRKDGISTGIIYLDAILFLGGGIIGTAHHWYWTGQSQVTMAFAAVFSALEVVPLTLLTLDAWDFIRLSQGQCDICGKKISIPHKWTFYFMMAVGFWKDQEQIAANYKVKKMFIPRMSSRQRESLYRKWKKAVERARGWEEEK
jgi:hypothetical protein